MHKVPLSINYVDAKELQLFSNNLLDFIQGKSSTLIQGTLLITIWLICINEDTSGSNSLMQCCRLILLLTVVLQLVSQSSFLERGSGQRVSELLYKAVVIPIKGDVYCVATLARARPDRRCFLKPWLLIKSKDPAVTNAFWDVIHSLQYIS